MNFDPLNFLKKSLKLKLAIAGGGCFTGIVILAVIVWTFIGPIEAAVNFAKDVGNFFSKTWNLITLGHFTETENAWYAELNDQYEYFSSKGIYIERELIASALFYDQPMDLSEDYAENITEDDLNDFESQEDLDAALEEQGEGRQSKFNYRLLVAEARTLSRDFAAIIDKKEKPEDEIRKYLEEKFIPYKFATLGYDIPKSEEGKKKVFKEAVDFVYLKREIWKDLFVPEEDIIVCGGADIPVEEFKTMTTDEYVNRMAPLAQADYLATGILPSVTLAQSMVESGWGKSGLAQKGKNFFGIKASSTVFQNGGWDGKSTIEMPTKEYEGSGYVDVMAKWRKYNTVSDSIKDHSALLSNGRYKNAGVPTKTTPEEQIKAIHKAGYATSPNYVDLIMNQIKEYDLTKYDTKENGSSDANLCVISGDFINWKQTSRAGYAPWEGIRLGNSSDTIGSAGCLVTSISIQMARSGTHITVPNFNPGTFVKWKNENNGFIGADFVWNIGAIAPNFKWVQNYNLQGSTSASSSAVVGQIADLMKKNYFLVIHVKGPNTSNHWVAVDRIQNGQVYIFDPAGANGLVTNSYHTIDTIAAFSAS